MPILLILKNNANRAAALVQQLLAFSRKQTLRPETVDFTELLSDIRNLILPLLGNNIQLKIIHGRDLWSVEVDQASFQRVIMNLVINARDAMPNGGIVTIATNNITKQQSAEFNHVGFGFGEYVQLTISDTGTGISAAVQEKCLSHFYNKEVGKEPGLVYRWFMELLNRQVVTFTVIAEKGRNNVSYFSSSLYS